MYGGKLSDEVIGYLDAYKDAFREQYPLMETGAVTEEHLISEIQDCLQRGRRYRSIIPEDSCS